MYHSKCTQMFTEIAKQLLRSPIYEHIKVNVYTGYRFKILQFSKLKLSIKQ